MKVEEVVLEYRKSLNDLYDEGELSQVIFLVFERVMNFSKIDLVLKKDEDVSADEKKIFDRFLSELVANKPVQYVLGNTWFYGLKLNVNEQVLIPRQETEELVGWIVKEIRGEGRVAMDVLKILDVCTGSGCIAVSLKKEFQDADVSAIDVSEKALAVARENSLLNQTEINFIQSDILRTPNSRLPITCDIIVSNPPYVLESEKQRMKSNVLNFEPHLALFVPENDPLIFYKAISRFATLHLKPSGKIYLEINETKGSEIIELLIGHGFSEVELRKDLNGKDRMIRAVWK